MESHIVKDVSRLEFEERCVVSKRAGDRFPATTRRPLGFAAASASSETSAGPSITPDSVSGHLLIEEGIVVRAYARIHPID